MLNELHSLSDALGSMSIPTKEWHREYKQIPKVTAKAPCIRIWIGESGSIYGFDSIDAKLSTAIRKYGNNQNSFPAFNIAPLYRITNKQIIKEIEQITKNRTLLDFDKIKSWCTEDNWRTSIVRKVNNCICKSALELQEHIEQWAPSQENSITALINSLRAYSDDGGVVFREKLEACVFSKLQAKECVETALLILFHKGNPDAKDSEKDSGSLSVILDYAGWQKYKYPVASEDTTEWINDVLLQSEIIQEENQGDERRDAFGMLLGNINEPMPVVKLPSFDVTLRAMFREQRCQERYGTFDDDSFPIAKQSRANVKRALEYISTSDKEDITWKRVDSKEIVFAYPSKLEAIPLKLASLLGPSSGNNREHSKVRFEKCAKDFIKTFRGLEPQSKPDSIRIFSIRKMDKARSKVVFTRNLSPEWYVDRTETWQVSCKNVPNIHLIEQYTPFPLEVADIINAVWKPNGELATQGKTAIKRMQYYQGMELLIDNENESAIRHYLNILLNNCQGLFVFYGNQSARTERTKDAQKYFLNAQKSITGLWSLFGLLLYKSGCKKEDYMENDAYLIGQLLKVSDELHSMYCRVKRKGEIPPQLAGNSVFVSASETPVKALAMLSQRMNPYIAWAKQYRTKGIKYDSNDVELKENKGKSSGLAAHYLGLYENIAAKLEAMIMPNQRFDDFEKAQVFLGYLAAFPVRENPNDDETHIVTENEEVEEEYENE